VVVLGVVALGVAVGGFVFTGYCGTVGIVACAVVGA
jgi:hypothetical protein